MTTRMLAGDRVLRIEWLPGTDTLVGTCHCTATHEASDPVSMWEWLLAHPDGHDLTLAGPVSAPRALVGTA